TARQFNSCRVQIEGKIDSIHELRKQQIIERRNHIQSLEEKIKKQRNKKARASQLHQKMRRLSRLQAKQRKLEQDHEEKKIRLCFGSKKLFQEQFYLEENGLHCHKEWKEKWQKARNSSFFLLGSKDETAGNQSCKATLEQDDTISLQLRLPDAFITKEKYLTIHNVTFAYGHNEIVANLKNCALRNQLQRENNPEYKNYGVALSYRFQRDEKGWRLFVSTPLCPPPSITRKELGAIGVDINADHLAVTETDRFGNPIRHEVISLVSYGKTKDEALALIGDASCTIVNWAITSKKPIVLEKLNFQEKKSALRESATAKQARLLSSFSYSKIKEFLLSRAFRHGVEVAEVNPAYTSVIGRVKFATRYGLSIHTAAALAIARRFLGVSERLPRREDKIPDGKGGHVTFPLPERIRGKHVWHHWRQVKKKLSAVPAAQVLAKTDPPSQRKPTCCDSNRVLCR